MAERVSIVRCTDYTYPQLLAGVRVVLEPLGG
jgi:uncharacterized protein (DUF362 family)